MRVIPLLAVLAAISSPFLHAASTEQTREEMTRFTALQIFLDNQNFNPGKIDGRWGEFTRKALTRYQNAGGKSAPVYAEQAPDSFDLPLDKVEPVFTAYSVTAEDVAAIGKVPSEPKDQAQQKAMPYESVLELVAERAHADQDFLKELNPQKNLDELKAGDSVTVPNVANPFQLSAVQAQAEGEKKAKEKESSDETAGESEKSGYQIDIIVSEKMLELKKDGKLVACFPITPGSESLPAPQGEWKITSITFMPWFRYDKKMLQEGERSDDAHNIPPGPNNAVGIVWMALNKKGIGIHGTGAPETIGRSSSHGCIRLANWDAWKLAQMVGDGTPVMIR